MSERVYGYYPGCSSHSTAREYDASTRRVCQALGVELRELPDWTCCGASYAHLKSPLLGLALPARNLALAADLDLPLVASCAACFSHLKTAAQALRQPPMRQTLSEVLQRPLPEAVSVLPLVKVLAEVEEIPLRRPLAGLKVAAYYGCLLVRPPEVAELGDPENPLLLDGLVERVGATAVDWGLKSECCGAGLAIPRADLVEGLAYRILSTARRAGADLLVTACPLCQSNLDLRQRPISARFGEPVQLPVLYITQLLGLALGMTPREMMLGRLVTPAEPALQKVGVS